MGFCFGILVPSWQSHRYTDLRERELLSGRGVFHLLIIHPPTGSYFYPILSANLTKTKSIKITLELFSAVVVRMKSVLPETQGSAKGCSWNR